MNIKMQQLKLALLLIFMIAVFVTIFTTIVNHSNNIVDNKKSATDLHIVKRMEHLEQKWSNTNKKVEELSCKTSGIGTRGGFCLTRSNLKVGGNWAWDPLLAQSIENMLDNQVVGDFGAGLGWYGRYFLRKRERFFHTAPAIEDLFFFNNTKANELMSTPQKLASWTGYDGATFVEEVTGGLVKNLDLSEPFLLPRKFDWIVSLEVGEHIPIEFEQNFLNNINKHACKGVVLSWSLPNQGGHHHVNNRPRQYIVDEMAKRDFQYEETLADNLRNAASLKWLKNTVMVYTRRSFLQHRLCPNSHP